MTMLSIIIPYYNNAKEINRTILSVKNALNFSEIKSVDFEVIIVNDGSEFSELEVLNNVVSNVNFSVNIISKCNGGVSSARNAGIEKSVGEYIYFLDSDDTLNVDFFEQYLLNVKGHKKSVFYDLKICNKSISSPFTGLNFIDDTKFSILFESRVVHLSNIFFYIGDIGGIKFDERIRSAEDHLFIFLVLRNKNVNFKSGSVASYVYDGKFHNISTNGVDEILKMNNIGDELCKVLQKSTNERRFLNNSFFNDEYSIDSKSISFKVKMIGLFKSEFLYRCLQKIRFLF